MNTAFSSFAEENFTGESVRSKIDTFCYYQIYSMPDKADFSPLCQPTIGGAGGKPPESN